MKNSTRTESVGRNLYGSSHLGSSVDEEEGLGNRNRGASVSEFERRDGGRRERRREKRTKGERERGRKGREKARRSDQLCGGFGGEGKGGGRRNGDENGEKKVVQGKWCDVRGSRITREKEARGKEMTRWRLSAEGTSNNL